MNYVLAQGFTTGRAVTALESIEVSIGEQQFSHGTLSTIRAELWSAAEGGEPESKLADLTVPSSIEGTDTALFGAAGHGAVRRYEVSLVLYTTGRVDLRLGITYSQDEDSGSKTVGASPTEAITSRRKRRAGTGQRVRPGRVSC